MTEVTGALSGHWLEVKSEEYDYVRFILTTSFQNAGIVDNLQIWKIENPDLVYKYERKSSGMQRVHSLVSVESLASENSIESLCTRGYYLGKSSHAGALFSTGAIYLPNKDIIYTKEYQYAFFEIAIGRSYAYDGNLMNVKIPTGYDSLYIPEQPLDRNQDGKFSLQEYRNAATFDDRDPR
jgi:hypothetical protein